jgi:uncharacterized membrane protein YphA (DoxX/SURF4 family)
MSHEAGVAAQVLLAAFLAVLFLHAGLDKLLDWSGNKAYITGFLSKTPMARVATLALAAITLMEMSTGVLSAAGAVTVAFNQDASLALVGAMLGSLSILCLFLGQRLAKDYAAAAAMVPYFLTTIAAILVEGRS